MTVLAASVMLLTASAAVPVPPTVLVDEVFEISPRKAGAVHLNLRQRTANVRCVFEVKDGADVRPLIVSADGDSLYTGAFSPGGEFSYRVRKTGDYKLIFDNSQQTSGTSRVYVKIMLVFMDAPAITAAPQRQEFAIFGTLTFFALIAGFAVWKIRPALIERRNPPPPTRYF